MTAQPLHPAIVHLPLGLAFLLPILVLGFGLALWRGRVRRRAWVLIVALQTLLLAAAFIAMKTGEREEDRVEAVVPKAALERHEAYTEQLRWATAITGALAALVLVVRQPAATRALTVATVAGTLAVAASAVRVGHAGGQLVYVHNAAAAYASAGAQRAAGKAGDGGALERQRAADDDR